MKKNGTSRSHGQSTRRLNWLPARIIPRMQPKGAFRGQPSPPRSPAGSVQQFESVVAVHLPEDWRSYAVSQLEQDPEEAVNSAKAKALEADPDYVPALFGKSLALNQMGKHEESNTFLDRILADYPKAEKHFLSVSEAKYYQGQSYYLKASNHHGMNDAIKARQFIEAQDFQFRLPTNQFATPNQRQMNIIEIQRMQYGCIVQLFERL